MSEESLLTNDSSLLDDEDFFIKPVKKKKILFLSDHPLAPSGVGVQARFLIEGLIKKQATFIAVGAAHLGGEKGVLNLLKLKGYTIEPLF